MKNIKRIIYILLFCGTLSASTLVPYKEPEAMIKTEYVRIYEWGQGTPPEYMPIMGVWEKQVNNEGTRKTKEEITINYGEEMKTYICYRIGRKYYISNPSGESQYLTNNTPFWWIGLPGREWR